MAQQHFFCQLALRQQLTTGDIDVWSHHVGDGSQPLHVSINYNSWGYHSKSSAYLNKPVRAQFEGALVKYHVPFRAITVLIPEYHECGCAIEIRAEQNMRYTLSQV